MTSSDKPVSHIEGLVHQALGMTMEFVGCNALPALELLDAQSERTKRPLVSVAVDVIERRYRPQPPDRGQLPA